MKLLPPEHRAVICLTPVGVAVSLTLARDTSDAARVWHTAPGSDQEPVALARQAVAWLREQSDGEFVDVRLFLSDYWLQHRVLTLADLPRDRTTRDELILWRMAQELDVAEGSLVTAWQRVCEDPDAGQCLVYATAMNYALYRELVSLFREAGYRLSHVGSLCRGVLDGKAPDIDSGVMAWLAPDHWLTLRFERGRITAVRVQRGTGAEAVAALQRDLARAVTEQGLRHLHVLSTSDHLAAASRVATALTGTLPDLRVAAEVAAEVGTGTDHPELVRLASRLESAAVKRELNFQTRMRQQAKQVRRVQFGLLAVTAAVLLVLVVASWRVLPPGAASTAGEDAAAQANGELAVARMFEIAAESERLAQLVAHRGEAVRKMVAGVQSSLPVNVRLRSLDYNAVEGRGLLVAESAEVMQLNAFVTDLEQWPGMDRVVVSRQLADPAQGTLHVYEVIMAAEL